MEIIKKILSSNPGGLLPSVAPWALKIGVSGVKKINKLVIVSAVCPDYERLGGRFTYRSLGRALPYIAGAHLRTFQEVNRQLEGSGIGAEFHVTLADTEFDLPQVVAHLAGGSEQEFLRRCSQSVDAIRVEADRLSVSLATVDRFTVLFSQWFEYYLIAVAEVRRRMQADLTFASTLSLEAHNRYPLYRAMCGQEATFEYCREMVIRQRAQYMTWGECATSRFGSQFFMMNHKTPNLSSVNDPFMRKGRPRIPILQLDLTTVPG